MMQYSSGRHENLTDPKPWVGADGSRRSRYSRYAPRREPRPEFERPLSNPANPILAYARAHPGEPIYYKDLERWPSVFEISHANEVLRRREVLKEEFQYEQLIVELDSGCNDGADLPDVLNRAARAIETLRAKRKTARQEGYVEGHDHGYRTGYDRGYRYATRSNK